MTSKNKNLYIGFFIAFVFIIIGAIYWKIAKDEIFYLCGNFSTGVNKSSVIRQLETANLSSYKLTIKENQPIIVFSSKLYFVTKQCIIEFDKSEKVMLASYK